MVRNRPFSHNDLSQDAGEQNDFDGDVLVSTWSKMRSKAARQERRKNHLKLSAINDSVYGENDVALAA